MSIHRHSQVLLVFGVMLCCTLSAQTPPSPGANSRKPVRLSADTPESTVLGNPFIAPKEWSLRVSGPSTILEAPEGDSGIALVDVQSDTAEQALAEAWKSYKPGAKWPIKVVHDLPDRDGWTRRRAYEYLTSPNEKRSVGALVYSSGSSWTVIIQDLSDAVGEKRSSQAALVLGRLLPKGYSRESFAGKTAKTLDPDLVAKLARFIEQGQKELGVPGVPLGLVQDGKVVFAGGFGMKELGGAAKPDGDTLFMIASNTKALTTLLLIWSDLSIPRGFDWLFFFSRASPRGESAAFFLGK